MMTEETQPRHVPSQYRASVLPFWAKPSKDRAGFHRPSSDFRASTLRWGQQHHHCLLEGTVTGVVLKEVTFGANNPKRKATVLFIAQCCAAYPDKKYV